MASRYQLVRKLATGGMAEVFLAKAAGPGGFEKTLVVKRILPQLAERKSFVEMFLAEARIAAQLSHPNIVQIFDFGEENGGYFIAMEYVEGVNLRSLSRWALKNNDPVALPVAARILALACEGLAYAHEFCNPTTGQPLNLIHRDMSADNIMVGRTGAVKLLDFGIARVEGAEHQTRAGTLKGKVAYMPVEQLRAESLDLRIDVYALGVVLYQLLTGHKPFDRPSEIALITAILTEPPTPLHRYRPDLPEELVQIVEKAMAREREDRFQNCREMQDALETFIAHAGQPAGSSHIGQLIGRALSAGVGSPDVNSQSGASAAVGSQPRTAGSAAVDPGLEPEMGTPHRPQSGPSPARRVSQSGLPAVQPSRPSRPGAPPANARQSQVSMPAVQPVRPSRPATPAVPSPAARPSRPEQTPQEGSALDEFAPFVGSPTRTTGSFFRLQAPPRPAPDLFGPDSPFVPADAQPPGPAPDQANTQSGAVPPQWQAPAEWQVPGPRPSAPGAPPMPAPQLQVPTGHPPVPVPEFAPGPPVPGFTHARTMGHTPTPSAPMAILGALRSAALSDRSELLVRKLPPVAARLMESAPDLTPLLQEACAGVLDAAMLAEEYGQIARLLERVLARTNQGGRFGSWLRSELGNPVRILWLIERLRAAMPVDVSSLQAWLTQLGADAVPTLMGAIDALEPGPGQDLVCKAVAPLVAQDPSPIVARLDQPSPTNVSAMCCILEAGQASDRLRVFQRLLGRRDVALTKQVMTGRAHALGQDTLTPLEAALGDRVEEIRLHALKLLGELEEPRASQLLLSHVNDPAFEKRSDAERTAFWAALCSGRDPDALKVVEDTLEQKTTLLNKKKSLAAKLPIIEGLARAGNEEARSLLERTASGHSQPDEVISAAKAALAKGRTAQERLSIDQRGQLRRSFCLDLFHLVRAISATDLAGGLLDPALSRLQESVRALVAQDGKLELAIGADGLTLNGTAVPLVFRGVDFARPVARTLAARDLRTFSADGPLPASELRAIFLQLCDPDGCADRVTHARVQTFSGRVLQPPAVPPPPPDPATRAGELYRAAIEYILTQRAGVMAGRLPVVSLADGLLDAWVRLYSSHAARLLSVVPDRMGEEAAAVHAANTALIGMSFASDLQLGLATMREIAELSLFWTLVETGLPPERVAVPGGASPDDVRLRLAGLFFSQLRTRRVTSYAVAAIEAGLEVTGGSSRGAGVAATIVALAEAWDALALKAGLGHAGALDQMRTRFSRRFAPELLELFSSWAKAQLAAGTPRLRA